MAGIPGIDPTQQARIWVDAALSEGGKHSEALLAAAQVFVAVAQVQATLALADEQRIANVIAALGSDYNYAVPRHFGVPVLGFDGDAMRAQVRDHLVR